MSEYLTKASLSPARCRLLELLQRMNFGQLESLEVRNREPVFDPPPRSRLEIRFPGENGPRPELNSSDFQLKQQLVELFTLFDQIENDVIEVLEVKHGLPFRVFLREKAA